MTITYLVSCHWCPGLRQVVSEAERLGALMEHRATTGHDARSGVWSMGPGTTNAGVVTMTP